MLSESMVAVIVSILRKHDVQRASLFGSYARGEAGQDSDIDILVDLPASKSLLDLVDLKLDLEDTLARQVDVVTYRSLHPRIKETVLKDEVVLMQRDLPDLETKIARLLADTARDV